MKWQGWQATYLLELPIMNMEDQAAGKFPVNFASNKIRMPPRCSPMPLTNPNRHPTQIRRVILNPQYLTRRSTQKITQRTTLWTMPIREGGWIDIETAEGAAGHGG